MEILNIKLSQTEKGFIVNVESEDINLRAEFGEKLKAFLTGKSLCCCCGCDCGCGCHNKEESSESCCK